MLACVNDLITQRPLSSSNRMYSGSYAILDNTTLRHAAFNIILMLSTLLQFFIVFIFVSRKTIDWLSTLMIRMIELAYISVLFHPYYNKLAHISSEYHIKK